MWLPVPLPAPEFVSQGQWLEAFTRWLQSLQARLGQQKVSRKIMVRRRLNSDAGAEEQYFHGPMLGEGAYGEVYAMFHRSLGVKRAVKVIHKSRLSVSPVVAEDEVLSMEEVAKHNTKALAASPGRKSGSEKEDCWVVLYGKAYDLTKFAKDIMDKLLKPSLTMGVVDAASIKPEHVAKAPEAHKPKPKKKAGTSGAVKAADVEEVEEEFKKPPMAAFHWGRDVAILPVQRTALGHAEQLRLRVMEPQAWGYYSSGGG
eukprot:Skav205774  [mRNA]  locus=scaffold1714:571574:587295:- [translate_table: standard]